MILARKRTGMGDLPCWLWWGDNCRYTTQTGNFFTDFWNPNISTTQLVSDAYERIRYGIIPDPDKAIQAPAINQKAPQTEAELRGAWDTNKSTMTAGEIAAKTAAEQAANRARLQSAVDDGSWSPDGTSTWWWMVGAAGVGVVVLLAAAKRGR